MRDGRQARFGVNWLADDMDLDNKYELGQVAANDSESKTFRAREAATGREVFVHLLFGGKPVGGAESLISILLGRMTDPAPERRRQILEISDYKGMPYAVTEVLPGFQGMRAWIEQERAVRPTTPSDPAVKAGMWKVPWASPPPPAAPATPATPATPEDEFDKLFGSAKPAAAPPPPAPAPPPIRAPQSPAPPPAGGHHEGEFTKLFRSTVGGAPPPPAAPPRPPATPVPPVAYTPAPTPPPASPRPPAAPVPPVAYTPAPPPPPAAPRPPATPVPPVAYTPAPPAQQPGEFTRMFQASPGPDAPGMPEMPPAPPAAPFAQGGSQPGEFTRVFGVPVMPLGEQLRGEFRVAGQPEGLG